MEAFAFLGILPLFRYFSPYSKNLLAICPLEYYLWFAINCTPFLALLMVPLLIGMFLGTFSVRSKQR